MEQHYIPMATHSRFPSVAPLVWVLIINIHMHTTVHGSMQRLFSLKRGLSGIRGCNDAQSLNLQSSWHYNWGLWPTQVDGGGNTAAQGVQFCAKPQCAEFVPMLWGCYGNCTHGLWSGFRESWKALGVTHILGWNEPDNPSQSNLSPQKAALYWQQLDALAQSFSPPLVIVGPAMTHWDSTGGSDWLDEFFGNLSDTLARRIEFLAQHDYSGDATGIVSRAKAAQQRYKRTVWLTEFAVGDGKNRAANDAFAKEVLPLLETTPSIARYAWFSARNTPASWVNESSLLPYTVQRGWEDKGGSSCKADQLRWLSQRGSKAACQERVLQDMGCTVPKTAIYQSGDVQNCYCANTTSCSTIPSTWQNKYIWDGPLPAPWTRTAHTSCAAAEMFWLDANGDLPTCQSMAESAPQPPHQQRLSCSRMGLPTTAIARMPRHAQPQVLRGWICTCNQPFRHSQRSSHQPERSTNILHKTDLPL
eukprot:m.657427 g.657427  ORF g.657427 m.657427 type:complete len:475 (+) comp22713_c0_seq3:392-1816(+)